MANIDTAAMESLLADLAREMQSQGRQNSAAFNRIAGAAGLNPTVINNTQNRLKALGDSAGETATEVSSLGRAGNLVGSILADLVSGVSRTIGNLANFATSTLSGSASVSGLIGAFKDLPIIGTVASLFAGLAKLQEENLNMYRSLSSNGINFGGVLTDLRTDFLSLGLTADQYSKVLKDNSDVFSLMGRSVSDGARNFRNINAELKNNYTGLTSLGYTYENLSQVTASYLRVIGGLSSQQQRDYKSAAASVEAYARELDLLARITGKSRESQAKQVEEAAMNTAWQNKLSTMTTDQQKRSATALAQMGVLGKGAMEALQSEILGLPPMTDAAQDFTASLPQASDIVREMAQSLTQAGNSADLAAAQNRAFAKLLWASKQSVEAYGNTAAALSFSTDGVSTQLQAAQRIQQSLNQAGDKSVEQTYARLERERQLQKEKDDDANAQREAMLEIERAFQRLAKALAPIAGELTDKLLIPGINWLGTNVDRIVEVLKILLPKIEEAATYLGNIFTEEGRAQVLKDISEGLGKLLDELFQKVGDAMTKRILGPNVDFKPGANPQPGMTPDGRPATSWGDIFRGMSNTEPGLREPRSSGSWGATGKLFENFGNGTDVTLHGQEAVVTPSQMNNIISGAATNNVKEGWEQLNNTNAQLLYYMKDLADSNRRIYSATKELSGDAFA
jgi:hypothetical protein